MILKAISVAAIAVAAVFHTVPEPAALALFGLGLLGLGFAFRRRKA